MEEPRKSIFATPRNEKSEDNLFYKEGDTCTRIDLRFFNEARISIPYAHVEEIIFEPVDLANIEGDYEQIIATTTSDDRIEIIGRNLRPVYDLLNRDKILWLRERTENEPEKESETYVASLQFIKSEDKNEEPDS